MQSIANLEILQTAKIKYHQLIKESKIKDKKKKTPQSSQMNLKKRINFGTDTTKF